MLGKLTGQPLKEVIGGANRITPSKDGLSHISCISKRLTTSVEADLVLSPSKGLENMAGPPDWG